MSPIKSTLVAVMLMLSGHDSSASEQQPNALISSPTIDFSRTSQVVFVWRDAPTEIVHKHAAIQPLLKHGFEVSINIDVNEAKGSQVVSYTLTRSKIQSQEEIQELLSGLVKATKGKGKVSVNISQLIRI